MKSFTLKSIERHEVRMQNGIRKVVSTTNGNDIPSTPSL